MKGLYRITMCHYKNFRIQHSIPASFTAVLWHMGTKAPSLFEDDSVYHDCSSAVRLCSHSCECRLQFFPMPVMWREADSDVRFLLHDIDGTEHDALDETVHGESLHLGSPSCVPVQRQPHRGTGGSSLHGMSCTTYGLP